MNVVWVVALPVIFSSFPAAAQQEEPAQPAAAAEQPAQPAAPAEEPVQPAAPAEQPVQPAAAAEQPVQPAAPEQQSVPPAQPAAAGAGAEARVAPAKQSPLKIAVMDVVVNTEDLDAAIGESISAVLAAELALRGGDRFTVIARNDLRRLVRQQAEAQQLGCDDPKCAADLGQMAAADRVVASSISKLGDTWVFGFDMIDVHLGQVISRQGGTWKGPPSGLVELVKPYVARLIEGSRAESFKGSLEILVSEEEASVHINEKDLGASPVRIVADLPIGKQRVRVTKDGYLPYEQDVVINHNEMTLVQIHLVDEASLQPWYMKWWVWTGAGAVVAGAIAAGIIVSTGPSTTTFRVNAPLPE